MGTSKKSNTQCFEHEYIKNSQMFTYSSKASHKIADLIDTVEKERPYRKYNDSANRDGDQEHDLLVVATVLELPIGSHLSYHLKASRVPPPGSFSSPALFPLQIFLAGIPRKK